MKTKNLFILGIAALIVALAACTDLSGGPEELSGEPIPAGMGLAYIRLDQQNARTTLPGLGNLYFTLVFTQGTATENATLDAEQQPLDADPTSRTLTVALASGDWNLVVRGYSDQGKSKLAVEATSIVVDVKEGISSNVDVALKPVFSGTGTLSYSVTFLGTVSRAFLSLKGGTTSEEIDLLVSAQTTKDLSAGSYQALIDLYDDTNNKAAVWTGVVHIYNGSTTTLNQTFDDELNFAGPQVVGKDKTTLEAKLDAALASSLGACTIVLNGTETDLGSFTPKTLSVTGDKPITIILEGKGKTVQVKETGTPLFTLGAGLTLVIQDLTLKGMDDNSVPVVGVTGGTLKMKTGSLITGNTSSENGGGVTVTNGGTFIMNGGEISGNANTNTTAEFVARAGGVYVKAGTFTMSDGVINNNTASGPEVHGGGVYINNGTFTMSGGTISGNTASASEDSGDSKGGGVYVSSGGTLDMSGGVIYGSEEEGGKANTAESGAAIYNSSGSVIPTDLITNGVRDDTIDKSTT
jgi:hypothetical protein